jgi:hypothetical protein
VLAAAEAVIGLFIEITVIATFTQCFFGGRQGTEEGDTS